MEYTVTTTWDENSNVWIATSKNIPGLVLESGSLDALIERIKFAVPELLELNLQEKEPVTILIKSEKYQQVFA